MSVYQPKNSRLWHFDFVINKKRYYGSTGVLNRRAAERVEEKKRREAAMGKFGQVAEMTLDAACGRFWEEKGKHRGDADDVERRLDILLRLLGATTPLSQIGQAEVAAAIEQRSGETFKKGKDRRDKKTGKLIPAKEYPISDSTVNRDISETLRPVLRRARSHWTPTGTPHGLNDIDWRELRLTEPRALSRLYSAAEREAWLAKAAEWGDDLDLALDLMLTNGLRYGEVFFPLDAPNLDPAEPTLRLQKGRKRDVLLFIPLRQDHARRLAARIGQAREKGMPHPWFYAEGKRLIPYTYSQVEYRLSKAADDAGISGARRIHGARHHAGSTVLKRSRGNLKAVQGMLGHASIASSQRYAHVLIDDLRALVEDELPRNSPEVATAIAGKKKRKRLK